MAKITAQWTAHPHGELTRLASNLWWVQGSLPGMSLKRAMTVARRRDGGLVIHSAVALDPNGMRALEALGTPAQLIVPSRIHRLDAPAFKKRYPDIKVYAPRGGRAQIQSVVNVDGTYQDFPHDDDIRLEPLAGVADEEGVMHVRSEDGITLVLNDAVFNMDRKRDPLGWLFTTLMGSAPGPRISRLGKWMLIQDQGAFRAELERMSQLPGLARLIVSHEKVAHGEEAVRALRQAMTYLRASR